MEHKLGLNVITTNNQEVLHLLDESIYDADIPYVCPRIHITSPGFQYSAEIIPEAQNFNLVLTACDLEIQTTQCDSVHQLLPDGVYAIKYSVSPNEYVFVEVNHLRLTKMMNRIADIYCELEMTAGEINAKTKDKLVKLNELENYLKSATYSIEVCGDLKKGKDLYAYAQKLIDKIDCKHC